MQLDQTQHGEMRVIMEGKKTVFTSKGQPGEKEKNRLNKKSKGGETLAMDPREPLAA